MANPTTTTSTANPTSRKIFEPELVDPTSSSRRTARRAGSSPNSATDDAGQDHLAEPGLDLARVADDRNDEPERRRRQHDRHEQRVADRLDRLERERAGDRERERGDERERDRPDPAVQPRGIDLEPGEEQEEREPEEREDDDGEVELEPARARTARRSRRSRSRARPRAGAASARGSRAPAPAPRSPRPTRIDAERDRRVAQRDRRRGHDGHRHRARVNGRSPGSGGLRCPTRRTSLKFTDPRLVAIYDTVNPYADGTQPRFYAALAAELGASSIVDLGCGTGHDHLRAGRGSGLPR